MLNEPDGAVRRILGVSMERPGLRLGKQGIWQVGRCRSAIFRISGIGDEEFINPELLEGVEGVEGVEGLPNLIKWEARRSQEQTRLWEVLPEKDEYYFCS